MTSVRLAPLNFAYLRSAWVKSAPVRSQFSKSVSTKSAFLKHAPRRALTTMNRLAAQLIDGRAQALSRGAGSTDDVLTMLLEARTEDGDPLPRTQIRDEIITLLSAGHETTANALAWTFYRLSRHPDVDRRLRRDLRGAVGDRPPEPSELDCVPYARWVFLETLRLHPPAWMTGRTVAVEHELQGHRLKPGDLVLVSPYVT